MKEYLKRIHKRPEIQQYLKKGITTATITNPQENTERKIIRARRSLLRGIVLDNQIREMMVTDENFKKLKNRLSYEITGYNDQGKKTLVTNRYTEDIRTVIGEMKKEIVGQRMEYEQLRGKWKKTKAYEKGITRKVIMRITFRKA